MIKINDPALDSNKDQNIEFLYGLIEAAKQDHLNSNELRGKLKIREYERRLNDNYPDMDNQTALQTVRRSYHARQRGERGQTIGGPDVYRVVSFFLRNLAAYSWPLLKKYIAGSDRPYNRLLDLNNQNTSDPVHEYDKLVEQKVGDFVHGEIRPGNRLRELAEIFDTLEAKLRVANTEKRLAIDEYAKLRKQVRDLTIAFNRIMSAYNRSSPEKQEKFKQEIEDYNNMLESLQKRL
jgi:hypothetical protein